MISMRTDRPIRLCHMVPGDTWGGLETLAHDLCVQGFVKFVGSIHDPQPFPDERGIFVSPSLHDVVTFAILEAFAAGVPVVDAAVGGILGMVGNTRADRLVQTSSPDGWAAALTSVFANPELAHIMAKRGRQRLLSWASFH